MSKRLRRASHFLLLAALMVAMGGHLVVLQTIAWSRMLVDFSSQESLVTAVEKTFDGEHPCPLCKVVRQKRSEQKQKAMLKAEAKWACTLPVVAQAPVPWATDAAFRVTPFAARATRVYFAVPVQPPRRGCALV